MSLDNLLAENRRLQEALKTWEGQKQSWVAEKQSWESQRALLESQL